VKAQNANSPLSCARGRAQINVAFFFLVLLAQEMHAPTGGSELDKWSIVSVLRLLLSQSGLLCKAGTWL